MSENEVLSPAEKIKKIRKKLRATQSDLSGNGISRVRISQIESGETLTFKVAHLLANNINKYIKDNNINIKEITALYLLESEEDQINRICKDRIDTLSNFKIYKKVMDSFETELISLEKFIFENEVIVERELKKELYRLAIDYYINTKEYIKSYEYILKCYRLLNFDEHMETIALIREFTYIYTWLGKFDDVVMVSKQAYIIAKSHNLESTDECKRIYFNCALAYKKLEKYADCYAWLQKMYDYCKIEKSDELVIKTLQANCCFKENKIEEALKLNYEVLNLSQNLEDLNNIALAYTNLAYIYYKQNGLDKAISLIDLAIDIRQSKYKGQIYTCAFYIYKETKEKEKAHTYLDNALYELGKSKNETELIEIINESLEYFIDNNLSQSILFLINRIEEIIIRYKLLGKGILDIFIRAEYYFKDIDSVSRDKILISAHRLVKFFSEK